MQDDPRKVSSTGEIVIYGRIFHPLPILILFSSHTAEKLHLLVIKEISLFERQSVFSNFLPLPYRSATLAQTPSQTANNWCTFLYRCPEVFKAPRNGSVCQKCFKNTSDSPSASISSRQRIATAPRALLAVNSPPPRRHGTCFIQHPIINLCEHPAGQTGMAAHQPAASCPICPSLTWPRPQSFQPHIYNSWRSSGFALTPLPAPIKKCRGIKPFGANISSCSESQWLSPGLHPSHGRGEACRDITQIFLKLSTSRSHKLRANHRRRHRTRRMYAPP